MQSAEVVGREKSLKRKEYETHRVFQDVWAAKLPWAESVVGPDGKVQQVRCKVCTTIEGRDKLLVPKLDSLNKHAGRRKAKKAAPGVDVGTFFYSKDSQLAKNQRLFSSQGRDSVLELVASGVNGEKKRKFVQFVAIYYLLREGRPITDFEGMHDLFSIFKVKNNPKKHWGDNSGWGMAESMHDVVLEKTRQIVKAAPFLSVSADEVTTIDNQQWISVHVYVVEHWRRIPILLTLERVMGGATANNISAVIVTALLQYGGLTEESIGSKVVCLGADGDSVFQGVRSGVTVQLRDKVAPFLVGVHCMAHRTNLAVQTLSKLPLVNVLEDLLQSLYQYFSSSPKRALELSKLAELIETKGLKILRNVKTRWISMLSPVKRVIAEYRTLVVKMFDDSASNAPAKANLEALCDIEVLLGLHCILPLLDVMHMLVKYAQMRDIFICDFVAAVKICQGELFKYYNDPDTKFSHEAFRSFNGLLDHNNDAILLVWVQDALSGFDYLAYRFHGRQYALHKKSPTTGSYIPVSRVDFEVVLESVKSQCSTAVASLSLELERRFPAQELMNALGIVYPQYWLQADYEATFPRHLAILKAAYCSPRKAGPAECWIPAVLDGTTLDLQTSLFKT